MATVLLKLVLAVVALHCITIHLGWAIITVVIHIMSIRCVSIGYHYCRQLKAPKGLALKNCVEDGLESPHAF